MDKSDIKIINVAVHILDSTVGMPVLSEVELDFGSDISEFLREHIYKIYKSDDLKKCRFVQNESEIEKYILEVKNEDRDFITMSKNIALFLYDIMNSNIDIPSADLFIVYFEIDHSHKLAILKMNYRESYSHTTINEDGNNINSIIKYRSILPTESQRLTEAAIIDLNHMSLSIIEKKFELNGIKENYFSKKFLGCSTKLSQKAKLSIVEKALESVQKEFLNENEHFEEKMKVKSIIHNEMEEQGNLNIKEISNKVFENKVDLKEKFQEKIEKYNIKEDDIIEPQNENTTKKFSKQYLKTDTGIEIKIPMEQYNNTENIEFITNEDGTISVYIKNIGQIVSK